MTPVLRRLLAWHSARYLLFWLPVFQLYLSDRVGLSEALRLEAIYYGSVFLLEVPTGWVADRIGRRHAMVASPLCWGLGAIGFASSDGFAGLALAQLGFAAGMATGSGADTAWLYDHLATEERAQEFEAWEARVATRRLSAMAIGALVGGALGAWDLRLPYLGFAIACLFAAWWAYTLPEPPRTEQTPPWHQAARMWASLLRDNAVLRWGLGAEISLIVLAHVPYELYQPWLHQALGTHTLASPVSGLLAAGAATLGAVASTRIPAIRATRSAEHVFTASLALLVVVIGGLALSTHPAMLGLVLLRAVPGAIAEPVLRARLHPELPSSLRATWWSVQSLFGRAAFAITLWAGARWAGGTTGDALFQLLTGAFVLGVALTLGVWWGRPRPADTSPRAAPD